MKAWYVVLTVLAVLGFSTPASALDLEMPALYLSAKFGVSFMSAGDIANTTTIPAGMTPATPTKTSGSNTVMPLGGAFGYNWEKHGLPLRTELEYLYRTNAGTSGNPTFVNAVTPTSFSASMTSQTLFVNAYYDVKIWETVVPYVGGGLGTSWNNTTTDGKLLSTGDVARYRQSTQSFAWNVGAGVGYHITDHIILDMNYRYVDLGEVAWGSKSVAEVTAKNLTANELLFGLRYQF